jgi:hypothetical protein
MKTHALLLWLGLCLAGLAGAAPVARVTHLSGVLSARHLDGSAKLLSVQSDIEAGDTLVTEKNTYARIKFSDDAEVVLRPGSQLSVASYAYDPARPEADSVVLKMLQGGMRAVTGLIGKRNRDAVSIGTPSATIGIRGTHFGALFCHADCADVPTASGEPPEDGLHVDVAVGAIALSNGAGSQVIGSGQFGYVRDAGSAPLLVPAERGIQVTMPTRISQNAGGGRGVGKSDDRQCVAQ